MKEAAESKMISITWSASFIEPFHRLRGNEWFFVARLTWTFVPPIPKLLMLTLSRRSLGQGIHSVGTWSLADLKGTTENVLVVSRCPS